MSNSLKLGKISLLSLLLVIFTIVSANAGERIAIYVKNFDPVLASDIENSKRILSQLKLDRIIFIPVSKKLDHEFILNVQERIRLLNAAFVREGKFSVSTENEIEEITKNNDVYEVVENGDFSTRYSERGLKKINLLGQDEMIEYGKSKKAKASKVVQSVASTYTEKNYQRDSLLGESLLTKNVADVIKENHWYGRTQSRGYYDLPENVVKWIDNEQKLNDRIENLDEFASIKDNTLDPSYLPENRSTFKMITTEIPEEDLSIVTSELDISRAGKIIFKKNGKNYIRFFIHPASEKYFDKIIKKYGSTKEYLATPTASHRSIVVWNPNTEEAPIGLKVSLDAEIGHNSRILSRRQIERATVNSMLFKQISESDLEKQGIRLIDEPISFYFKDLDAGMTARPIPPEILNGSTEMMPMFSLYSTRVGRDAPILEMIEKSGMNPRDFCEKNIIKPLVNQLSWLAFNEGLIGESHEQNVLIEVNKGLPTGKFYYRDLGGFYVNLSMRKAAGKSIDILPKGFMKKSLRNDLAGFVRLMNDYILQSNLYAMTEAVKKKHSSITHEWTEKVFLDALSVQVEKYTGHKTQQLSTMKAAITKFLKNHDSFLETDCSTRIY